VYIFLSSSPRRKNATVHNYIIKSVFLSLLQYFYHCLIIVLLLCCVCELSFFRCTTVMRTAPAHKCRWEIDARNPYISNAHVSLRCSHRSVIFGTFFKTFFLLLFYTLGLGKKYSLKNESRTTPDRYAIIYGVEPKSYRHYIANMF